MDSAGVVIAVDDPARVDVRALIAEHLADMRATSPAESVHALDVSGLLVPAVTFWTARAGDVAGGAGAVLGCTALKDLGDGTAEIKSMRTATAARGRGIGRLLLAHLLAVARERGYRALALETGAQDFFAPARSLYAGHGFAPCGPFADYRPDPHSVFLRLEL